MRLFKRTSSLLIVNHLFNLQGNDPRHARVRLVEVVRRNDDAAEVRHHMRQMMLERRRRERQRMERERERLRFLNEEAVRRKIYVLKVSFERNVEFLSANVLKYQQIQSCTRNVFL